MSVVLLDTCMLNDYWLTDTYFLGYRYLAQKKDDLCFNIGKDQSISVGAITVLKFSAQHVWECRDSEGNVPIFQNIWI